MIKNSTKKTKKVAKKNDNCQSCESDSLDRNREGKNPDHTSALARLKKVKGQILGVERMIADGRYCVDILVQFRAIVAGLSVIESEVLERHIRSCVQSAVTARDHKSIDEKISELMSLIVKRLA